MVEFNFDVLSITSVVYMSVLGVFGTSLNVYALRKALLVSFHLRKNGIDLSIKLSWIGSSIMYLKWL